MNVFPNMYTRSWLPDQLSSFGAPLVSCILSIDFVSGRNMVYTVVAATPQTLVAMACWTAFPATQLLRRLQPSRPQ